MQNHQCVSESLNLLVTLTQGAAKRLNVKVLHSFLKFINYLSSLFL